MLLRSVFFLWNDFPDCVGVFTSIALYFSFLFLFKLQYWFSFELEQMSNNNGLVTRVSFFLKPFISSWAHLIKKKITEFAMQPTLNTF